MKISVSALAGLAVLPLQLAVCFPGMQATVEKIEEIARGTHQQESPELLGDLLHLSSNKLSHTGAAIRDLLEGKGSPQSNDRYGSVHSLKSPACRADTCCVWKYIADDLEVLFRGEAGRCTKFARQAIRMGFHDAGCWSKATAAQGGGADGSLVLSSEASRVENKGMELMGSEYKALYQKYHALGFTEVTMADLIQMGATTAAVVCPLGPRVRSFVGRKDSSNAGPEGLLPSPFYDAEQIIDMFQDKTISSRGLVALLGAHSVSQQSVVDVARAGDPQDSTPGVWDTLFYQQRLGEVGTPDRVYSFPSDVSLAQYGATKGDFEAFAGRGGQQLWNQDYARAYVRLSMLGVNNINSMTECTKALPSPQEHWSQAQQHWTHAHKSKMHNWLHSHGNSRQWKDVSAKIESGAV